MNLPSSEQPSVPSVLADGVVHFVRIFISSCSGGTFGINHGGGGNDGGGRMLLSVADQVLDDIDEEEWFHDYVVTANDPGPVLFVSATLLCVFLYAAAFAAAATTCGERLSGGKAKKLPRQPSAPLGGGGGGGDEKKEDAPDDNGGDGGEGGGRWAAAAAAHPFVAEDDGQHQRQALLQHPMFVGTNDGDDDDPGQPTHHQQGNKKWGRRNSMGKFMRRLPPQPTRHQRRSSISGPTVPSHPAAASVVVQHDHEHWFLNPTASTFAAAAGYGSLTVPSPRRGSMTSPRRGSMTSTAASSCAAGPPDGDVLGDPALAVFSDANNNNTGGTAASPSLRTALLKAKAVTDCCDGTTRDILRLAGPFVVQALLVGGSEVIRVALVGHLLGTAALSAYVIVDMLVRLTGDCVESILAAGSTLIAQLVEEDDDDDDSDDDDNGDDDGTAGDGGSETSSGRKTADQQRRSGQYLQLSLLLYIVAYLPTVVLWSACMGRVLVFLGYTPSVAEEGRQFAIPYTLATLARGSGSAFQLMLDVVGYEVQSTVLTGVAEVGTTAVLGLVLWWREDMTLLGLGCLHLAADIACLVGLCAMIHHRGWLKDYYSGLFFSTGGCTLFTPAAVQLVLTNSAALALTHLVYHCEWQILTFFASSLGRAEVVAWGLLGTLWDVTERVATAVGEAAEVRVAMYLGSGQPTAAKVVVYKSYWLSLLLAAMGSALLLAFKDDVPGWLTRDELLQEMLSSLIPFIAMSNPSLTMAVMSWSVLYAQNRFHFSVTLSLVVTLCVTLPLAGLSSIGWNIDLQGQTSAVVTGIAVSGSISLYKVLKSDWKAVSNAVITTHEEMDFDSPDNNGANEDGESYHDDDDDDDNSQ